MIARHAFVSGRVQGVAFRWATVHEAERLGVAGWVRNLTDGRVEVWLEGEPEAVGALERWLADGPPHARVERVAAVEADPDGAAGFTIRR